MATIPIPQQHRPIFDGLDTVEEKTKAAMEEYNNMKEADEDGLDFANKTSMWIAYERYLETSRPDAIISDPLAQYLWQPYGKRLSDACALGLGLSIFNPPGADIGFGLEGHVMYTAARTKMIDNEIEHWLSGFDGPGDDDDNAHQIVNIGAGMDTRVFSNSSLTSAKVYWEVDTTSVIDHKQKVLEELAKSKDVTLQSHLTPFCLRRPVRMDFGEESIADLPSKHGFDSSVATCWILEGIIMYLKRADVEELMDAISKLSSKGSKIILNFSVSMPNTTCPGIDEIDERLEGQGWSKVSRRMFGEKGFNFGRYPKGKPANKILGFAMYQKE